jgi:hypothetical protein
MVSPWRFYVYELIDPRDGLAFYVGKGQRDRLLAHEGEARKGVCSEKCLRIRDIWDAGLEVRREVVAHFRDEQAAYDYEAERVEFYGLDALTNIIPGGGSAATSRRRHRASAKSEWNPAVVADMLCKRPAALIWFAQWLKLRANGGGEVSFYSAVPELSKAVLRAGFQTLFPMALAELRKSREQLERVARLIRPHGVELVYGGA